MSWLLFIFYLIILIFVLKKLTFFQDFIYSSNVIIIILCFKISIGIGLNLLYKYKYERSDSDIYKYFDDSKYIYKTFFIDPVAFLKLIVDDEDNSTKIYIDSTKNWKNQTSTYNKLTNSSKVNFSNHRTITKFNAFCRFISLGNINIHVLIINFFSLVGSLLIVKAYRDFTIPSNKRLLFFVVMITPSFVLWSSGVLKEGLITFSFGMFLFSIVKFKKNVFKFKYVIIAILSVFILLITKYYLLIILLPLTILYFIKLSSNRKIILKYILSLLLATILFSTFKSNFDTVINLVIQKQNEQIRISHGGQFFIYNDSSNFQKIICFDNKINFLSSNIKNNQKESTLILIPEGIPFRVYENGNFSNNILTGANFRCKFLDSHKRSGSYFELPHLDGTLSTFLINIPKAFLNTLFRPLTFRNSNIMSLLASLENVIFFVYIFLLLCFKKQKILNLDIFIFNILFSVGLYIFIGFTTPVEGGLHRYKILGYLLILISFTIVSTENRFKFKG